MRHVEFPSERVGVHADSACRDAKLSADLPISQADHDVLKYLTLTVREGSNLERGCLSVYGPQRLRALWQVGRIPLSPAERVRPDQPSTGMICCQAKASPLLSQHRLRSTARLPAGEGGPLIPRGVECGLPRASFRCGRKHEAASAFPGRVLAAM